MVFNSICADSVPDSENQTARSQSVFQSNTFSHAAAAFRTVTSSYLRPTSIMPVGSFISGLSEAGTKPQGSDNAG